MTESLAMIAQREELRPGGVAILTGYLILLIIVPAPMVVPALGSAGSPALILAMAACFMWLWFHANRQRPFVSEPQPVRRAALIFALAILIIYAHAMLNPITFDEVSPADSGMLRLLGLGGVLMVAHDGLVSMAAVTTVLRRLTWLIALVAVLGIVQFVTKRLYIDQITLPGLTSGAAGWTLGERGGLVRTSGTSTSPIEFGVILTISLPVAITLAFRAPTGRWPARLAVLVIAFAAFLSISRSAMLCAAVGMFVLWLGWSWVTRGWALAMFLIVAGTAYLLVPGLLGTVGNLFTGASEDASVASRTGSYEVAFDFIERSPWPGRGFGTFLPKYWILDNGYLGMLIDGGVLGLLALLFLLGTAGRAAWFAACTLVEPFHRDLARAVLASGAAGVAGMAFFDIFAFPQTAGCLFLMLGLAGAVRRIARESAP